MNEYLRKRIAGELASASSDAMTLARDIVGGPLENVVCIMSGLTPIRLGELSGGASFTAMELVAFLSAVDYLMTFQTDRTMDGEDESAIASLEEKARDGMTIAQWFSAIFNHIEKSGLFCADLVDASESNNLDDFFSSYHFFVDASALCSEYMCDFTDQFVLHAKNVSNPLPVTIPRMVAEKLDEMLSDPLSELGGAETALTQLRRLQDENLLSVRGDSDDSTLMATFMAAFSRYKPIYRMVFLTQDPVLANAVHMLNVSGLEGPDILIASISEYGIPCLWFPLPSTDESETSANNEDDAQHKQSVSQDIVDAEAFDDNQNEDNDGTASGCADDDDESLDDIDGDDNSDDEDYPDDDEDDFPDEDEDYPDDDDGDSSDSEDDDGLPEDNETDDAPQSEDGAADWSVNNSMNEDALSFLHTLLDNATQEMEKGPISGQ